MVEPTGERGKRARVVATAVLLGSHAPKRRSRPDASAGGPLAHVDALWACLARAGSFASRRHRFLPSPLFLQNLSPLLMLGRARHDKKALLSRPLFCHHLFCARALFFFFSGPFFLTMTQFLFFSFFLYVSRHGARLAGSAGEALSSPSSFSFCCCQRARGSTLADLFFAGQYARTRAGPRTAIYSWARPAGRAHSALAGERGRPTRKDGPPAPHSRRPYVSPIDPAWSPCLRRNRKENEFTQQEGNRAIDGDRHRSSARSHADNNVGIRGDGATGAAFPRTVACRARL